MHGKILYANLLTYFSKDNGKNIRILMVNFEKESKLYKDRLIRTLIRGEMHNQNVTSVTSQDNAHRDEKHWRRFFNVNFQFLT